jgi:GT2 family glycosyltransferase
VVVTGAEDLPRRDWGTAVQTIIGPTGVTAQRNVAVAALPALVDYVAFFDDDVELRPDYLEEALLFLERSPGTVGISGRLVRDGHVSRKEARELIATHVHRPEPKGLYQSWGDLHSFHGCNMVIRRGVLEFEKFDENLPLYGFAEDYNLSMRLERYGLVGKFARCVAVHLAVPVGRVNEVQRGYSLIANQWYHVRHGLVHVPPLRAQFWFWNVVVRKTLFFTVGRVVRRSGSLDWRGRLKGLLLALLDLARGRCHPRRILEL